MYLGNVPHINRNFELLFHKVFRIDYKPQLDEVIFIVRDTTLSSLGLQSILNTFLPCNFREYKLERIQSYVPIYIYIFFFHKQKRKKLRELGQ